MKMEKNSGCFNFTLSFSCDSLRRPNDKHLSVMCFIDCLLPAEPPWRWPVWMCNCASCLLLARPICGCTFKLSLKLLKSGLDHAGCSAEVQLFLWKQTSCVSDLHFTVFVLPLRGQRQVFAERSTCMLLVGKCLRNAHQDSFTFFPRWLYHM